MFAIALWAFVAALVLAVLSVLLRKPRQAVATRLRRLYDRVFQRRVRTQLAINRLANELTRRLCDEEGNADSELRDDYRRWFLGDPDADVFEVFYARKQQRDLQRLRNGRFVPDQAR